MIAASRFICRDGAWNIEARGIVKIIILFAAVFVLVFSHDHVRKSGIIEADI